MGRKKRFYKGWNGISCKALQYVCDSDDFNILVGECVLDIYQAKNGLFTWFDLQVCNQRYKRFLLHSVIHYL